MNTDRPRSPTVIGELHAPQRKGNPWTVTIQCPHCTQTHIHGAGQNGETGNGHRVSHCDNKTEPNTGYIIKTSTSTPT